MPVLGHSDSFSRAQVTITLVDENDHKPKIERITTASGEALEGKCSIFIFMFGVFDKYQRLNQI